MTDAAAPALFPYPVERVIFALQEGGGVFSVAAAKLGCTREVIELYVESLQEVRDALAKIDIVNADVAQAAFLKAIGEGKSWAVDRAISRAPARPPTAGTRRGNGPGWGGPARTSEIGDCRTLTAQIFATSDPAERKRLVALRRARAQEIIGEIAESAEREETRMAAAAKLNQIDGGEPPTRNFNLNADLPAGGAAALESIEEMDDDQLVAELTRLRGAGAADPEGAVEETMPQELPRVRH